jgi:hypothetical protein
VFELLAVPQSGIPCVQMGFRIVLCISNLFSIYNSDFLPRIQYICWNFSPSCFISANMWVCHISLLSRWISKYLAVSPCGICFPFSVTDYTISDNHNTGYTPNEVDTIQWSIH